MTVVLDGAMGTELARRGFALPSPRGSAGALYLAPNIVRAIHLDAVRAGAQILTTHTFSLLEPDPTEVGRAVELAREAIAAAGATVGDAARVRIAGCIGALGRRRDRAGLSDAYNAWGHALADAGCDLLLVETVIDADDARAATKALGTRARHPLWMSAAFSGRGALLGTGTTEQLPVDGVDAFLVGCTEAAGLSPTLAALAPRRARWRGVAPSTGHTRDGTFLADGADPVALRKEVLRVQQVHGLDVVGGCCGTTPRWLAAVAAELHPTQRARSAAFDALDRHLEDRP